MKKISARQLARAAGVSQATVSRVANESPLVHPETRRKVIEWARKLNYDLSGRSAGKGVCILLHHRKNPLRGYPAESLMALGTELPRRGYQMKIVWDESLPLLGDTLLCGGIDLTGDTENVRFWESNFTLPLIRVNAPSNRLNGVGAVILDGYSACLEAVRHLRKLGHSRIGFVSLEGRRNELAKLSRRWEGFAAGLRESGVEHPEEYGIFPDFRATEEEISRKVCGAIRSGYTALISPGDIFGLRIASALQKSGFRIPLDVSLIEGEWPGVSEFMNPPRTTVGIDYPALAVNLLDMLEHYWETGELPPDARSPMRLALRESTAQISAHDSAYVYSGTQRRILRCLEARELNSREIAAQLQLHPANGNFKHSLAELRRLGLIEFTIPDSPRSVNQKLRLRGADRS